MHPHLHLLPSQLFCFFLIFIFTHVPKTLCQQGDERYTDCSTRAFDCGEITGIDYYPFWGKNRPSYCGLPEFELTCQDDVPVLTIGLQKYRVLKIKQNPHQILKIARLDFWDNSCQDRLDNRTTFDYNHFDYAHTDVNLTLYYDCPSYTWIPPEPIPKFNCSIHGISGDVYPWMESTPSTPSQIPLSTLCTSVLIPVLPISYASTTVVIANESILQTILRNGFEVDYTGGNENDRLCSQCIGSGGRCGYLNGFTCFCPDRPYPNPSKACPPPLPPPSKDKKRWVKVALGISSGVIAGAFLVICIVLCRKKLKFGLVKRKDISTPSTTVSSNPSSRTKDLEKGSIFMGVSIPIFTYEVLEEATNNFDASKELGDGGFGTVYHGKLRDGRDVAVKRLYENNYRRVEQFMNEIEILTRLRHKNLVTLYGCTSRRSRELILVYEYIPNGTVADHLHGDRAKAGGLPWSIRMSIALETAGALTYLHASDIIHRDVKTNNILLDNNFSVKVADFGLSRLFPTDATHVSTAPQGTPGYVDPEYHQCYQLTGKSDVYSFGVVLIELISSKPAVDISRHRHEINLATMAMNKIQNRALHELVDPDLNFESDSAVRRMVTGMAELAFRCLQYDREMRPTMDEALEILNAIGNEDYNVTKTEEVDTQSDQVDDKHCVPALPIR
ncbi:PREDICTED: LEAF RUST 10 DISEASE-RESISTANCE LOCUS RECEPTOR-LIKE PROTEIN KINASE-like 1.2 isoform X4 [Nelumbo nucifera]|uniref:non-specific serine/threonine protein kinase n=1 Tax=Nelumbo nucifera TaxID=4432 RepID=A0A1U8BPB8_NELNU|nr:PREDICTED: LEAF RUST 10 DISEASE-RESISTANCE LOCUS RECEPTOR-LIKE PROTEIN KINASE-like 1.2 isoform X4 [Nelumbo nucifera]